MKNRTRFTASAVLIAIAASFGSLWLISRREGFPVSIAIRFEFPTNGVYATNALLAADMLNAARSTAREQEFQTELAKRLGTYPDHVRTLHVEQYRCTTIMDATFVTRDSTLTNRLGSIAFGLRSARLTNQFPSITFALVDPH